MEALATPSMSKRSTSPPMTGPTTDFALIEAQKENIRPAASGRSAATLSVLLEKDAAVDAKVQERYEQFKRDIEEAERLDKEGEDMVEPYKDLLDVYILYVAFSAEQQITSGSHIIPLLESTTRRFTDDGRYQQDNRYLGLWVMFARHIERREEIWSFLDSRNICTNHAAFYEEWAIALEGLGRKKKADDIYKLGIARRAAPTQRLKNRHVAFLERIMAPDGRVPDDEPVSASRATDAKRTVLGAMSTPGHASASSSSQSQSQSAASTRNPARANGSKMAIFADGDAPAEEAEGGVWQDFGTRDERRKENVVEATPWKGETMPQSAKKPLAPRTPKMEIFKDTTNDATGAARPADDLFTKGRQITSDADLIKADPLRFYDLSAAVPVPAPVSLPAPPSARKPPRPARTAQSYNITKMSEWDAWKSTVDVLDERTGKMSRRKFDVEQVYKNKEEWSFNEIRARQRGLLGREWRGEVQDWERAWHAPGSSTPVKEPVSKPRMPSPTVNTKLANEEVAMMFDQTIHGRRKVANDSDSDSSDESDDYDDMVHVAPTPLPSRSAPIAQPPAAPAPAYMVPPTPTPVGAAGPGKLNIFADENNGPGSAMKLPRANIFDVQTPARPAPPAATGSSSKKAFGIFSDENAAAEPAKTPVASKAGSSVFATPAPRFGGKASRAALQTVITEEAEDEDEAAEQDENANGAVQGLDGEAPAEGAEYEEEYEEGGRQRRGWMQNINVMTPITERTMEYTSHTGFSRLSLGPASASDSDAALSSRRTSTSNVFSGQTTEAQNLSVVDEEEERSRPERSASLEHFVDTAEPIHDSFDGRAGPDFALPEGFTIHARPTQHDDTMASIVDRSGRLSLAMTEDGETDTGAFVTATAGDLAGHDALPNPCCPVDDAVISRLLGLIQPPLSALPGFIDQRSETSAQLDVLHKFAKTRLRRSQNSRVSLSAAEGHELQLGDKEYEVMEKVGEGGFGAVFSAVDLQRRDDLEDDEDEEVALVAIKVESPTALWEAVVLDRLHSRLDAALANSIIRHQALYAFADESFLVLNYSSQGTLLDLVNKAQALNIAPATSGAPQAMDEILAIFFTIELLRLVEGLHAAGFIHGDLKIDNCLLRLENIPEAEGGNAAWSPQYARDGSEGWSHKGVRLIDFGRAIDMQLWPAGERQQFIADWPVDERDCMEIKEGRSWSYQTDYAGLASVAYCMLFGKYIQTETVQVDGQKRVKIATPLKRYWQTELWTQLFDVLLNSTATGKTLPITVDIAEIRAKFEDWLEANCTKGGKNLRGMLKKITTALASR